MRLEYTILMLISQVDACAHGYQTQRFGPIVLQ